MEPKKHALSEIEPWEPREKAELLVRQRFVSSVPTHFGEPCDGRRGLMRGETNIMKAAGLGEYRGGTFWLTARGRAVRDRECARLGWKKPGPF